MNNLFGKTLRSLMDGAEVRERALAEALVIPLYGRKLCSERYPSLYRDETAIRLMLKTWIKDAAIQNVGAYFAVADARRELSAWDSRLQVSSRGYMLGYNDLKDPSVSGLFRFLARVGDNRMNMQIVKLGFGDGR